MQVNLRHVHGHEAPLSQTPIGFQFHDDGKVREATAPQLAYFEPHTMSGASVVFHDFVFSEQDARSTEESRWNPHVQMARELVSTGMYEHVHPSRDCFKVLPPAAGAQPGVRAGAQVAHAAAYAGGSRAGVSYVDGRCKKLQLPGGKRVGSLGTGTLRKLGPTGTRITAALITRDGRQLAPPYGIDVPLALLSRRGVKVNSALIDPQHKLLARRERRIGRVRGTPSTT